MFRVKMQFLYKIKQYFSNNTVEDNIMDSTRTLLLAIVLLLSVSAVWAGEDDPVYFADENLKQAIKDRLGITTDPTEGEMATLTYLFAENRGIKNLTGIEYALILERLNLSGNQISDISPLEGLANLIVLRLPSNQISNLSPLSALTKLITLTLESNQISSVSALSTLTNLTSLTLWNNQIQDISALSGLTQLTRLDLPGNQIDDIDALAGLTTLTRLTLGYNQISDISALSALTNLTLLTLYYNQIEYISALAGMTALTRLELQYNPIHDISPLTGLTTLETIKVKGCPLSWESYCLWGPVILANNPNLTDVRIDPNPYNCGCAPAPTPEGSSVIVTPTDNTTGTSPVTLTFEEITESGGTTLVTSESGPTPPSGFQLGDPATYYDITTTSTYSGLIVICISYSAVSYYGPKELLRLYHYEDGSWSDCTTLVDTENDIICGEVTSLSAFAILMPEAPVFQSLTASPNVLWPPNHKLVPITVNWIVLDDSGLAPVIELKRIIMNEGDEINTYDPIFDDTQGDGHTTTDIQIKDGVIYLRAERSGTGTGRAYTLTYEATDTDGNVGTASVTVTVPHEAP